MSARLHASAASNVRRSPARSAGTEGKSVHYGTSRSEPLGDLRAKLEGLAGEATASPVFEQVFLVGCVALLLGGVAIGMQALTHGTPPPGDDPDAACRTHDWIGSGGGRFVCLRCSQWLP
jgi:hypothetical protein